MKGQTRAEDRSRLLSLLRERSFRRGKVRLASGKESDFFVDAKQTVLLGEGHALAGALLLEAIEGLAEPAAAVAGVALGGCPLASAVATLAHLRGRRLDALYVRKEVKDHGSARRVEGDSSLAEGAAVAVVEDVVTTGGSTLRAVEELRARGHRVIGVVALIDREEGARVAFEEAGVPFSALYHRGDFLGDAA